MNVLFYSVPIMDFAGGRLVPAGQDFPPNCPSLSTYLLAAVLRDAGHRVSVIDLVAVGSISLDLDDADLNGAGLIAISATSLNWPAVLDVIGQIRAADVTAPVVVGGVHPTMFSDYILSDFQTIDYVVRNEGEVALTDLCARLEEGEDVSSVPNLSWRTSDGRVVHNSVAPVLDVDRLAALPLPAYDLMPPGIYPSLPIQSSRGCPFSCSFCSTSHRRSYRGVAPEDFVDRLEAVLALGRNRVMEPDLIQIIDDEWSINRKRSTAILRELDRRGLEVQMTYDSRANDFLLDDEYIELVAPHTAGVLVGAECGYDDGLRRIGKGTTTERLRDCAALLHRYDIAHCAEFSFILGLPWESKEDALETVRFAFSLASNFGVTILLQWYWQLPGSHLWDASYARGIVAPAMYNEFGFFRNLYLFSTGNRLEVDEVWEVMDVIDTLTSVLVLRGHDRTAIRARPPAPIEINFPRAAGIPPESSSLQLVRRSQRELDRAGN
ncbi:B12-binding domain-containing radical SAM protein [Denitrobaculum tricleocarpae]|uniref:B12-binding domain-containing radical SAM protein n=1 Tax=Denitrobaculum tricleocarpae TaxID=2591009 RepID=A0A545TMW4_9PROT|nr:radical SAM protein [Denitrobaculum tricleocarpae]TQV78575.1 B12-binding domain-containing radical SAM protein [Denitrobaculum tricleocarpae]